MTNSAENNKRIAKNTLILYVRMLLTMAISLYTSRVVLNTLGVTDYGIYNVVGGVITMLSFLTGSMGAASSRYITYDLGKGDMFTMKRTFGNILSIHFILAGIILLFGETIGLWFVLNKLQIPENRMVAAFWVYQCSILTSILSVISIPYNAAIIAHEKMKAFAYIGIIDAILKLLIVYLLLIIPYDKLIIYSFLFLGIQTFDRIVYGIYCTKHFKETKAKCIIDKKMFKEIFNFATWTMIGCLASIGANQGVNILLNLFFGPIVNAAYGISSQVQSTVKSFCNNFQMALNPQLTKSYAQNDLTNMHKLLKISSKFSFFLLFLLSFPLILETELVLTWWLGDIPNHTVIFLRLMLCASMIGALSNPLVISIHATGRIKRFQIIEGLVLMGVIPISYILLKYFHTTPEYVFWTIIFIEICTQYVRIKIVLPRISMPIQDYIYEVIYPILKVIIFASVIPIIIYNQVTQSVGTFFLICIISLLSSSISIFYFGCTNSERSFLKAKILSFIRKINRMNFIY